MKLDFKDHEGENISDCFGWSDGKYERLVRKLALSIVEEAMTKDTHRTRTQILSDWLDHEAVLQGFTFETPNDMFVLGYAFRNALDSTDKLFHAIKDDEEDGITIGASAEHHGHKDLAKTIIKKKIKEAVSEIEEKTGHKIGVVGGDLTDDDEDEKEKPKDKLPN